MDIDLSQLRAITNEKPWSLFTNQDRYLWEWGGGDAGKSHGVAEKLVLRMLMGWERGVKHKFLVVRKTQPSVRQSAFELVKNKIEQFGIIKKVKITKNPMEMVFPFGGQFVFAGLDDPEKIKSMEGVTSIWAEEVTELTPKDYMRLDLILRGFTEDYMQIIGSFNPVDEESWIKKQWFDTEKRPDVIDVTPADWPGYMQRKAFTATVREKTYTNYASYCHFIYQDNKFVTDAGIATLEGLKYKDTNFYNVYCLGKWGVLKGLIYENWGTITEWPRRRDFDAHGYGLDFGFTNSPSALVECGFIGDDLYVREHIYNKGLTNPDISSNLAVLEIDDSRIIVADSAEPKSIEEIKQTGYTVVSCQKGKDSVYYGIQRVKQYNIKVYYESVNLIKEFKTYKWAENRKSTGESDQFLNAPVDFMNHCMDAMRYIVTYLKGLIRAKITFMGDDTPKEERKERLREAYYAAETDKELLEIMEGLEQ